MTLFPLRKRVDQSRDQKCNEKIDVEQLREHSCDGNDPEPVARVKCMTADAVHRADDECGNGRLHTEEDGLKSGRIDADGDIEPREGKHQHKDGEHEAETCKQCANATTRDHAKINTEFMRFRAGQRLIYRKDTIEAVGGDPLFFVHEFLADHSDLCDGSSPGEETEFEEAAEEAGKGLMRDVDVGFCD